MAPRKMYFTPASWAAGSGREMDTIDIGRNAGQLDAEEQQDDVVGAGDEKDPRDRQQHQAKELANFVADVEHELPVPAALVGQLSNTNITATADASSLT